MNIKVDRKEVDKLVKEINLFKETKKAIASYQSEVSKLDNKEDQLKKRLVDLQAEHVEVMLAKEVTDEVGELVYLEKKGRELVSETEVINSMLEKLTELRFDLKLKHVPLFRQAISEDQKAKGGKCDVTEAVIILRYEMMKIIADVGRVMADQYREVEPGVSEVFEDKNVLEIHPQLKYGFNQESWKPFLKASTHNLISDSDIAYARMGSITEYITKPKGKE